MKTRLIILYLFFGFIGYGQNTRLHTKIIEVDLSAPHKNSIKICEDATCTPLYDSKWLSAKCSEMIAIKLINGNPFKYTYKIDTKNISFFNEKAEVQKSSDSAATVAAISTKSFDSEPITINKILLENQNLDHSLDRLNGDVDNFYTILKQKNTFVEADYIKRHELRNTAEKHLAKAFELLINLEDRQTDDAYFNTKEHLLATKEKATQSIQAIVHLLYTIDLEVYNLPIDVQGKNIDVIEFKLRRFDKETKDEDLDFASTPYNIWIKGGLKIDVSAGIFFTSLYDEEYDKRDDPATAGNKIIMLKNSGDYDMAFGSTINTYIRMNSWIVPILNFGAVITQNEKLQVLLGGGVILGKQERIIFSAGISMGKVDRIADGYQVGGSYNLGDSGNIPTQSQFKFGNFFGITYNLSKVKKISLDKGIEEN
ncbi:hypothetical protein IRZ71_17730 [Flavobacterium sp. ANB]|uniref:hypothetical protein n=1 Tax=unclassified Flavobacterium TaxID=196869 RepID=UPI0012B7C32E|nr:MULTISPECIES: hypothetical protein [unclassified Flavobacterium]MBF4518208.1 hypothetical protein [Flavobacterium sp. ANB]MTD71094.1 hypothetical protein [Flavobacterium sp. LC2016-13]